MQGDVHRRRERARRERGGRRVAHQVEHDERAARAQRVAQARQRRAHRQVVQRRDRGDALEADARRIPAQRVALLERDVREAGAARARGAQHLGGEIDAEHRRGALRERAGEVARATAEVERGADARRERAQQHAVVVRVVIEDAGQARDPVEVGADAVGGGQLGTHAASVSVASPRASPPARGSRMLPRVPRPPGLPPKPLALRALDGAGAALRAVGVAAPSLAPERLMAAARRRTGLDDFGDASFREGLERLVDSLEREAALTTLGRLVARSDLVRLLEGRLRMEHEWAAHPEIARGEIRAPIFVLGLPRTGTTILQELLAQDPANRMPMTWEVMHPWPPPARASFETDPRIARVERHLAGVERLIPGFHAVHRMGAALPQECVAITAYELASLLFSTTHRVPGYQAWLESLDHRRLYAAHRRWLQYFQWRAPGERWVLKSPGHLWTLDALLAVYPDARIVQTHRDPLRVVRSLVSLCTLLRSMASDDVDPDAIAREWAPRLAAGLVASMRARDAARLSGDRVFDVAFCDFVGREIDTVRRLYERFGLALSADAEARMRRYLAANPPDKHGAHRYQFGRAALDPATERRRFASYVDRYEIAPEPE
ncbi:MAG: hypothetical protein DCC71_07980 [Proteobacteria bacterium]|nr:MAG: hypothetical protein DCC71_07980 [Pseudomonadota bacterium]